MINCIADMSPPTDVKPKVIDLEDNESSVSENSRKDFDESPTWISEFTTECLKVNGLRSPEKLDQLMADYLELLRADLLLCQMSPNRSQHVVFRMQKTLSFFYNYFLDIKEMFFVTQWNENMVELMAIYSYLEIKASLRVNRRDSDLCIAARIYKYLYLYFDGNEEHIIHTFLKTPLQNLKCKGIFDPMLRKVLVTNRAKRSQTYSDLEYIRNLLCYKLWKRMCTKEDKKNVTEFAITHNKPPSTLVKNMRKYRFFPKFLDNSNLNLSLSTCVFHIEDGIREYFERHEPKNGKHFGSIVSKERKTFISRLYDVFCESDSTTENIGDSFMDNILLDQIKTETEAIQLDDEDSDDDCVFVDPSTQPLPPPPPTEPVVKMVIDLTSNEPDAASGSDLIDLTPEWCKRLLVQAKLELLQTSTTCEPVDTCEPVNTCEPVDTCMSINDQITTINNGDNDTASDREAVNKLDDFELNSSNHQTTPIVNVCKDVPEDSEMVVSQIEDFQTPNDTMDCEAIHETPIDNSAINHNLNDYESTNYKSVNVQSIHTQIDSQSESLNGATETTKLNGDSTAETDEPNLDFELVNNNNKVDTINCSTTSFKLDGPINNNINPINCNTSSLNDQIEHEFINNTNYKPIELKPMNKQTIINNTSCGTNIELVDNIENCEPVVGNVQHIPIIRCKSVDLEPRTETNFGIEITNANEVEGILTNLNTPPNLDIYQPVLSEPVTRNINRENINKTPLDIIDDFCSSSDEEEQEDGFSEITSTSHDFEPVKLQPIMLQSRQVQFTSPIPSSSNQTRVEPPRCKTPYPLQMSSNRVKTPIQVSKHLNGASNSDWDQSFDKVDSTSGLNEESCHTPTITPVLNEQTDQLRSMDNLGDELSNQSEPTPVSDSFASFATKPSTDHSIEMIVSTPKIATKVHDLSKLVPQFKDSSDSESESSSTEDNLVISSHNNTMEDKVESDDQSPSMEPICGKDYAGYLTDFSMTTFADFQRESLLQNADLTVNKTVKIRTYNSIKPRPKPKPVEEPCVSVPVQSERRVPVNGEKILRFETELWEPVYINTFKLTKKEFNLFNPQIKVNKCDKRDFGIHDDRELVFPVHKSGASAVKSMASNSFEALHSQLFNVARTNSILERQDYVKGAKQTRALVQTRPLRNRSATSRCCFDSASLKSPNSVNQSKKRGIDLNLLFSSPDCSVSLNNSFQHHFCSDISTCSSNCLSPTLNLSSSLDSGSNHSNSQLNTDQNHLNSQINHKLAPPLETFTNQQITVPNPQLNIPNYSNICDKIAPSVPNHLKLQPNPVTSSQICDKLPATVPNHPNSNLQFNVQICDESPQTILNHPKPQHNHEPNPTHLNPVPHQQNAQIRVNFSHTEPAGLESVPNHPTIHLNQDAQVNAPPSQTNTQLNAIPVHPNLQFNLQIRDDSNANITQPNNTEVNAQFDPLSEPILPPPVPQPAHISDLNTYWQNVNPDQQSLMGTNLLVNINVDQMNTDHEIHLPIKKRRVSSLKVEIKDEISYPSTPMISIAELENIKTEQRNIRPFKTPAELKEVPPLPPSYLLTVPNHVVTDNLNINHTFNNPTINYHVNNVPVINFQYTPHYHQLPPLQPILVPVNRTANWQQPAYGYLPTGKVAATTTTGKKRNSRATERKKTKTKS